LKALATIIIGFIAGLAISGVLGDLIDLGRFCAGRIQAAWLTSMAANDLAGAKYSAAAKKYSKALTKISPKNKNLTAKTKSNLALSILLQAQQDNDKEAAQSALLIFHEALELFKEIPDEQKAQETQTNIQEAEKIIEALEVQRA